MIDHGIGIAVPSHAAGPHGMKQPGHSARDMLAQAPIVGRQQGVDGNRAQQAVGQA